MAPMRVGLYSALRLQVSFIKHGILQFLSLTLIGDSDVTPPRLYFQSSCLGAVLYMAVNNSLLRLTTDKGNKYGVDLWS